MCKFFTLILISLLCSCFNSSELKKEEIPNLNCFVSDWNPKTTDGTSFDLITELRTDLEPKSNTTLVYIPKNISEGSVKVECVFENKKIVALCEASGSKYYLEDFISTALTKWINTDHPTLNVTLIANQERQSNQSRDLTIIAIAVEGGPFFKLGH